jgi:putative redox protein
MGKVIVRSGENYRTSIHARHHTVYADEPVQDGGSDSAPTPTELMMGALGACMVITVQLYARRKNWPLEGVEIALEQERFHGKDYEKYQGEAQFVHEIRDQLVFRGPLSQEQRARLLEIAGRCPVHRLIENPVFFIDELLETESLPAEG